jgi:hypothetical protein
MITSNSFMDMASRSQFFIYASPGTMAHGSAWKANLASYQHFEGVMINVTVSMAA